MWCVGPAGQGLGGRTSPAASAGPQPSRTCYRQLYILYSFVFDRQSSDPSNGYFASSKKQVYTVPFSMAIGNVELMHECFTKHLCMGTARMK